MTESSPIGDVRTSVDGHVSIAELCRAPNNYFDMALIGALVTTFERFDADLAVRVILLCAEGRNFCAGADFSNPARDTVGSRDGDGRSAGRVESDAFGHKIRPGR